MKFLLAIPVLMLASCGLPKDAEGTLDAVRAAHRIRVGFIAEGAAPLPRPEAAALLRRLAAATGARPVAVTGDAEPLLSRLEDGDLDLVLGRFTRKTPWRTLVTLSPPLATEKQRDTEIVLAAAMRNGENEWVALVEREARALPGTEQ